MWIHHRCLAPMVERRPGSAAEASSVFSADDVEVTSPMTWNDGKSPMAYAIDGVISRGAAVSSIALTIALRTSGPNTAEISSPTRELYS